jgi:tripartite-type tricarboxylate transporter receptor subunit TctC
MAYAKQWQLIVVFALAGMLAITMTVARAGSPGEDRADHRAARGGRACRYPARTVAQQMVATSGQNVVVENRPGGAGAIGGEAAARSPASEPYV